MEFEKRNIFFDINKMSGNGTVCSLSGGWPNLLTLPLEILKEKVKKNNMGIKHYLNRLKDYTGKTYTDIAIESNHKESYLKDIFTTNKKRQKRMPNRDCIIGLCFSFGLNLNESNYLLKTAGFNELYQRDIRDLIIMKCLSDRTKLIECNKLIIDNGYIRVGNLDFDEQYL